MSLELQLQIPRKAFDVNVELKAPKGKITAIFGPSGSGKTTLLRAIAGLEPAARGFIRMNDTLWQDGDRFMPPHRRDLGFVFQDAGLFPHLNVSDNLRFGIKRQRGKRKRASLEQAIDLLALGPLLTRSINELSGGEKQRVAIGRAIATSPAILLLDEPLAAVDHRHRVEILRYIQTLQRDLDMPMLYVSHAVDEVARLSDQLVLLDQGRQRDSGATTEMLARPTLPFIHFEDAAAIIDTVVSREDQAYALSYLSFTGGEFAVSHGSLRRGDKVRLRILARDVSISLQAARGSSILNILPVTIDTMVRENRSQVLLRLSAAGHIILSRITAKSASELDLHEGKQVFAQIKAVSLLI